MVAKGVPAPPKPASALEMIALNRLERAGLPAPVLGWRFDPKRRWEFDAAWVKAHVALELEGGIWSGGRHVRGKGYTRDCIKYAHAAILGWMVIRCTREMVEDGTMVELVAEALWVTEGIERGPDETPVALERTTDAERHRPILAKPSYELRPREVPWEVCAECGENWPCPAAREGEEAG